MDTLAKEASSEPGGLKVGFELMLELSGIERIMEYEGGLVLSGLDTALVPLPASDWPDYFRWHLSRTPGKSIKVPEVIQNIGPRGWDKVNNLEKFSGHVVYVGWVVESTVLLGTCHSAAAPDLRGSSVEAVKQVKSKSEDAAAVQLQGQIPHGPTIAGQFQRTYLYGPTVRLNDKVAQFGQSLDGPKSRRVILYDDETKNATLVPELALPVFATPAYINRNGYCHFSRQANPVQWTPIRNLTLPLACCDIARTCESFLLDKIDTILSMDGQGRDTKAFKDIVTDMSEEIVERDLACRDHVNKERESGRRALWGFDLREAVCREDIYLRRLKCTASMKAWAAAAAEIGVVFVNGLGTSFHFKCPIRNINMLQLS